MFRSVKWIAGAGLAFALAGQATATPVFYTNEANFLTGASNAGVTLSLESFESATGAAPISVGDITITNSGTSSVAQSFFFPTDGAKTIAWVYSGKGSITFAFDDPINAFGIDIMDLGDAGATTLTLTTSTGDTYDLFTGFTGANGNIQYGGVIDNATAFVSATFSNTSTGDFVAFDRLHGLQQRRVGDRGQRKWDQRWCGGGRADERDRCRAPRRQAFGSDSFLGDGWCRSGGDGHRPDMWIRSRPAAQVIERDLRFW